MMVFCPWRPLGVAVGITVRFLVSTEGGATVSLLAMLCTETPYSLGLIQNPFCPTAHPVFNTYLQFYYCIIGLSLKNIDFYDSLPMAYLGAALSPHLSKDMHSWKYLNPKMNRIDAETCLNENSVQFRPFKFQCFYNHANNVLNQAQNNRKINTNVILSKFVEGFSHSRAI